MNKKDAQYHNSNPMKRKTKKDEGTSAKTDTSSIEARRAMREMDMKKTDDMAAM